MAIFGGVFCSNPGVMVKAGCLDCCEPQHRVLEERTSCSVRPWFLLSVVSLRAAIMKEGAGVAVWIWNHMTYYDTNLTRRSNGTVEPQMPLRHQALVDCL